MKSRSDTMFFWDNERRIDMVLAYEDDEEDDEDEEEVKLVIVQKYLVILKYDFFGISTQGWVRYLENESKIQIEGLHLLYIDVPICPRGYLPFIRIYPITGYPINGFYCTYKHPRRRRRATSRTSRRGRRSGRRSSRTSWSRGWSSSSRRQRQV